MRTIALVLTLAALSAPAPQPASAQVGGPDYLSVVRRYADALLDQGRDVYGPEPSPLIAVTLDRQTGQLPEGEALERIRDIPRESWGIRPHDRMLSGANPMHDQNLYQVLYALAEVTGEPGYALEADRTLQWFFEHTQSPQTGLLAWGEHIGWDFRAESIIDKASGTTHEFFRPWVLWEPAYRLAPEASLRFARGLWEHQIGDHRTGNFSRHARYDLHGPELNSEFPRHGGFYIAAWAEAYRHSGDDFYLGPIRTLLAYFDGRRHPVSDQLPAESHERSRGEMAWPGGNLSYAVDLWAAADHLPDPLASELRRSARRTDDVFLRLRHEPGPGGRGFLKGVHTGTLEPLDGTGPAGLSYTQLWATGYGEATHANYANLCLVRYRQVGLEGCRHLALAAADAYLEEDIDTNFPVYPGTMGDVILLLIDAHEITGEERYLARAEHFARRSIDLFLPGPSPLPQASSHHAHYEAITRADTLMMALLKLWAARHWAGLSLDLTWTDR